MSLNGLETDAIRQAHQHALSEAGGWLMLRYVTRDTVELLGKGNGGVAEARRAVDAYEEKSPLYGLLQYRRKKIILKYVPDGTSRLLQARLSVHFQAVLDAFVPHDMVFGFAAPTELSESALGLSGIAPSITSEHASSSSLRQQRLNLIAEDNEEMAVPAAVQERTHHDQDEMPQQVTAREEPVLLQEVEPTTTIPASAAKAKAMLAKRREAEAAYEASARPSTTQSDSSFRKGEEVLDVRSPGHSSSTIHIPPRTTSIAVDKQLPLPPPPPTPPPPSDAEKPRFADKISSDTNVRPSVDQSLLNFELESDSDEDLRRPTPKPYVQARYSNLLSPAENTSINKWTADVSASTASEGKRAPRESVLRPKTAGASDSLVSSRPVANLPTTVRVTHRPSSQMSRPGSRQSSRSVPTRWAPDANLPPPLPSPTLPRTTQPASHARKVPMHTGPLAGEPPNGTPEKLRLMKALQMRKRTQLLAQRSQSAASSMLQGPRIEEPDTKESSDPDNTGHRPPNIAPELASVDESVVTSPTSINTTSDHPSTKPSSVSEHSVGHKSISSICSDTNSSTTPRADVTNAPSQLEPVSLLPKGIPEPDIHTQQASSAASVADTITQQSAMASPAQDNPPRGRPLSKYGVGETTTVNVQATGPRKKRYHFEGTIHIPPPSTEPFDISDDEDLLDELQHATVHEAKPMAVSRSHTPITPVFAKVPTRETTPIHTVNVKARSTSDDSQATTPDKLRSVSRAGSVLSLATALPQWPPQTAEPLPTLPKQKLTIGATISKRVKAFEGLSQRDTPSNQNGLGQREPPTRAASISNMLKRTSFLQSNTEKALERPALRKTSSPLTGEFEPSSANTQRVVSSKPWVQRPGTGPGLLTPAHEAESISVTARIVREAPRTAHGTGSALNMHRSPLIIERGIEDNMHKPVNQSADSLPVSPIGDKRRFSFTSHPSGSKTASPIELTHKSNRLSFSSYRRPSRPPSISETSSIAEDKRTSRTNRILKRLSGLGRSRNRDSALTSPTHESLHPDTIDEAGESPIGGMRHVVDIGEVNVQFPDSLLWRRRFLRVDDHGFLIFAPPPNEGSVRGNSRKLHLDELRKPYLPDREREEMAWSILLDLKSSGTVQCACESKSAQSDVLKMLIDAHAAYNQLYGV